MRLALPALLALCLLAGCTAAPTDGSAPTATPEPLTPSDATSENTVAYESLSPLAKEAFEAALAGDAVRFGPDSPYVEDIDVTERMPEVFDSARYITRNGSYYVVSVTLGEGLATYDFYPTRVNASRVVNETVYNVSDLSADVRDPVRTAIERGRYEPPANRWTDMPEPFSYGGPTYVEYEGRYYEVLVVHGDDAVRVVSVSGPVEK